MTSLPAGCVCLVTDRRRLAGKVVGADVQVDRLCEWLTDAIGVVDLIQIREPDLEAAQLYVLSSRVVALASGSRTRVLVNSRSDVAAAARADGVHLRADGLPAGRVRPFGGSNWLIGRSAHTSDEAGAEREADYVTFGTVFGTPSKRADVRLHGVEGLREAVRVATRPVLAIGGINAERAARCREAGAAGIAAIGAFLPPGLAPGALGITAAADAFRRAMLVV